MDLGRRSGEETNRPPKIKHAYELDLISQNIKLAILFFLSGTEVYSTVIGHEMWFTLKLIVCFLNHGPFLISWIFISIISCEDVTNRKTQHLDGPKDELLPTTNPSFGFWTGFRQSMGDIGMNLFILRHSRRLRRTVPNCLCHLQLFQAGG